MIHLLFFLFHTFTVDKRQNFAWSCVMLIKSVAKSLSSLPISTENNNNNNTKSENSNIPNYSILAASRLLMLVTCKELKEKIEKENREIERKTVKQKLTKKQKFYPTKQMYFNNLIHFQISLPRVWKQAFSIL